MSQDFLVLAPALKVVSYLVEPSQPLQITSGLKETFIKGYIADDLLSEVRERSLDSGSTAPTCNISASPTVYVCVSVRAYVRVCVSVRARARARV